MKWPLLAMAGINTDAQEADAIIAALGSTGSPGHVEAVGLLIRTAGDFVLAGGRFSTTDWLAMTPIERAAAVEAGERALIDRALRYAAAARGGIPEAQLVAPLDGGARVQEVGEAAAMDELRAAIVAKVAAMRGGASGGMSGGARPHGRPSL